jgi:organic radical activating enzyme
MNLYNIKKVELEISSGCNAACPGCARTQNLDLIKPSNITLADLKRLFPTPEDINGKVFKFCGVLGDPAYNPECVDMVEYLAYNNGWCQLSTNGGIQPAKWWAKLGKLCKDTNNVDISFCIDGHRETNHIYRVNVSWEVLERNIKAYTSAGGTGTWIYIVFDHNEHEVNKAEETAKELGLRFATRTGMRNSYHDWVATIKRKDQVAKKIVSEKKIITTTGKKEHSKVQQVNDLVQFTKDIKKSQIGEHRIDKIISTIECKFIHEAEIFIGSDLSLWPCCFLYDSAFKNKENINDKLKKYGIHWNSLVDKSINEVLDHEWFAKSLYQSWYPSHKQHLSRCITTCAYNKAYHNEIKYKGN